jgi:hypothetical protein
MRVPPRFKDADSVGDETERKDVFAPHPASSVKTTKKQLCLHVARSGVAMGNVPDREALLVRFIIE